jgi:cardiolipin synthase
MLPLTQLGLRAGLELRVNWLGRWAVWPTMSALGLAMITQTWLSEALLYLGVAMSLAATALYLQDGLRQLRAARPSSST